MSVTDREFRRATCTPVGRRRWMRFAIAASVFVLVSIAAHVWVGRSARLEPPRVSLPQATIDEPRPGVRTLGASFVEHVGRLWVVHLSGTPEQIGFSNSRLLYPQMVRNEGILLGEFTRKVSIAPARWLLLDLAQLRYRNVDASFSDARKREIAAGALGFSPDPYEDWFPTYQRFVYLNALYDISLSFEHSPLIGCTTFTFSGEAAESGHTLLARAFDFDVHDIFDQEKAVYFVREDGQIPFASVAWPGLVGVMSGINAEGLAVVVHGGRAGEPRTQGEPVVHTLRRVLSTARTVDEAARALGEHDPMVSHIVIVTDAQGHAAAIERVPGAKPFVRPLPSRAVVTNHFTGPYANDPKNLMVRKKTSSVDREARGSELCAALEQPVRVEDAVRLLRDRRGVGGAELRPGDRRAIDASIATHGVVMDSGERTLWVSEAPHLSGRFVAFDLAREFALDRAPPERAPARSIEARPNAAP